MCSALYCGPLQVQTFDITRRPILLAVLGAIEFQAHAVLSIEAGTLSKYKL
jgi:hypothetical protein